MPPEKPPSSYRFASRSFRTTRPSPTNDTCGIARLLGVWIKSLLPDHVPHQRANGLPRWVQPSTSYGEFKREILNEIARCLNMPYNVAAGNSSGYNYASGRLDHQTYFKSIRVEQSNLEAVVLDRVLAAWFDEAVLIPGLLPAGLGPFVEWSHQWFWDGHEHVDPAKEASAQATRLASHTTTLADEYARRGQDWETQLRQRAKERSLMDELGLSGEAAQLIEESEEDEDAETADQST